MHDQRAVRSQLAEHLDHRAAKGGRRHPEQLARHAGRIRERPEDVEDRPDPDLAPHGRGMAHRWVESRREHEPDADLVDARGHGIRPEVDLHAEGLQDVGAAARARRGTVAVLRDPGAGRCRDDRRDGRDVERAGAIATGAARVDRARRQRDRHGGPSQRAGESRDLLHRLAAHRERGEQARKLGRGRLASHDAAHRALSLGPGQRPTGGDHAKRLPRVHRAQAPVPMKLRSRATPSVDSTDSGWNWTASSGSDRCRMAITTPSSLRALTKRSGGSVAASTMSEW